MKADFVVKVRTLDEPQSKAESAWAVLLGSSRSLGECKHAGVAENNRSQIDSQGGSDSPGIRRILFSSVHFLSLRKSQMRSLRKCPVCLSALLCPLSRRGRQSSSAWPGRNRNLGVNEFVRRSLNLKAYCKDAKSPGPVVGASPRWSNLLWCSPNCWVEVFLFHRILS